MIYDYLHWFTSQKRMMFKFATSNNYQSPEGNYSNLSIIQSLGPIGLFTASSVRENGGGCFLQKLQTGCTVST
jgi:hypothetical protein